MNKKYSVTYTSLATGFNWNEKRDTIQEVKYLINTLRFEHGIKITVYDYQLHDFIYDIERNKIIIDLIYTDPSKDLRTTDRRLLEKC